jgi:phage repressor protein C with HTH and peptisase S24 domain
MLQNGPSKNANIIYENSNHYINLIDSLPFSHQGPAKISLLSALASYPFNADTTAPETAKGNLPDGAIPVSLPADENIPVRGLAAAGNGLYHFDAEPIEYVATPDSLRGVKGAFAMYVRGDSMEDVLFEGSLIYIHPYQPPRVNDLVVVERTDGGVLIKRLVRRTDRAVTLREYSPKRREFDIDRGEIRHLYRVSFVAL